MYPLLCVASAQSAPSPDLHAGTMLCQDAVHDIAVDIGQSEVASGMAVGEAFVIQSQRVKQRCVKVVHMDRILDGRIPEIRPWKP